MDTDKTVKQLRKLIAKAMHDANHINREKVDSNRSQAFLIEADEKLNKARKLIKKLIKC